MGFLECLFSYENSKRRQLSADLPCEAPTPSSKSSLRVKSNSTKFNLRRNPKTKNLTSVVRRLELTLLVHGSNAVRVRFVLWSQEQSSQYSVRYDNPPRYAVLLLGRRRLSLPGRFSCSYSTRCCANQRFAFLKLCQDASCVPCSEHSR